MNFLKKITRDSGIELVLQQPAEIYEHIIKPGTPFDYLGQTYHSLGIDEDNTLYYLLKGNTSLDIQSKTFEEFYRLIKEKRIGIVFEEPVVIDDTLLTEEEKMNLFKLREVIYQVIKKYGPDYTYLQSKKTKTDLKEMAASLGMHYKVFRRKLSRFLSGGMKDYTLLPKNSRVFNGSRKRGSYQWRNKPGRKNQDGLEQGVLLTDEIREIFDVYVEKHLKSAGTLSETYDEMILREFTTSGLFNKELTRKEKLCSRPTFRQFQNHFYLSTTEEERLISKHGYRDYFNNKRALTGDINFNAAFPGDIVQIDAMETNNSLIARDGTNQPIGRATVYMMRDVYTRLIVAYSISFEVNSVIGLTNLLMNLCDDKVEHFESKGYPLLREQIPLPDGFIPNMIVTDRGSDFTSLAFQEITMRLGIEHQFATTGAGSSKGLIERTFRQMDDAHKKALKNNGLITKEHNSKHHQEAMLTLDQYEEMVLAFIVSENYKPLASLPAHLHSLVNENIPKTPINIWKYATEIKKLAPRRILDKNQFYFDLMTRIKVKLDRQGLHYKGLRYDVGDDPAFKDLMLKGKTTYIDARMDTRDISRIYSLKNGKWKAYELSPKTAERESFWGWSLPEYMDLEQRKKAQAKLEAIDAQDIRNGSKSIYENIVQKAKNERKENKVTKNNTKNMREHRKIEKLERRKESTLHEKVLPVSKVPSTPDQKVLPVTKILSTSVSPIDDSLHDDRSYEDVIESIEFGF